MTLTPALLEDFKSSDGVVAVGGEAETVRNRVVLCSSFPPPCSVAVAAVGAGAVLVGWTRVVIVLVDQASGSQPGGTSIVSVNGLMALILGSGPRMIFGGMCFWLLLGLSLGFVSIGASACEELASSLQWWGTPASTRLELASGGPPCRSILRYGSSTQLNAGGCFEMGEEEPHTFPPPPIKEISRYL